MILCIWAVEQEKQISQRLTRSRTWLSRHSRSVREAEGSANFQKVTYSSTLLPPSLVMLSPATALQIQIHRGRMVEYHNHKYCTNIITSLLKMICKLFLILAAAVQHSTKLCAQDSVIFHLVTP